LRCDSESPGSRLKKAFDERVLDVLRKLAVPSFLPRAPDYVRKLGDQRRRLKEVRRCDQFDGLRIQTLMIADAAINDEGVGVFFK
jgi:hypothetical protein